MFIFRIIKSAGNWIFFLINILFSFIALLTLVVPYVPPIYLVVSNTLSLIAPIVYFILFGFIVFWLIVRPIKSLLSVITLGLCWKQITAFVAITSVFYPTTHTNHFYSIKILDWNIRGFNGKIKDNRNTFVANEIVDAIKEKQANIVCLQEFNTSKSNNHIEPFLNMYPYYFFSKDYNILKDTSYHSGNIIFSMYPILRVQKISFHGTQQGSVIFVDIKIDQHIIRVYTTHLASYQFTANNYDQMNKIITLKDSAFSFSRTVFTQMQGIAKDRYVETKELKQILHNISEYSILTGDFNDVPNSYTYWQIKGSQWDDAFTEGSIGIGKTFNSFAWPLRIDYIFYTHQFSVKQMNLFDVGLSDHAMLVATLDY